MIKGYIDRVFSHGFAYRIGANGVEKLLTGKKVVVFNTQGTPADIYERSGMFGAMRMTSDTGIYEFCGMTVLAHRFFDAVPYVDETARKGFLDAVRKTTADAAASIA